MVWWAYFAAYFRSSESAFHLMVSFLCGVAFGDFFDGPLGTEVLAGHGWVFNPLAGRGFAAGSCSHAPHPGRPGSQADVPAVPWLTQ